jgi:RNA polymerase sigma-70 factor (ECF subfamily)
MITDEQLAQQAQAGCAGSFEELVTRFEGRLYRFVANRCGSRDAAQEVTQDSFVAAYRALERFDVRRSFAAWLFAIARRKCVDYHRRQPLAVGDEHPNGDADDNDPATMMAQRESAGDFWRRVRAALPELQFEAVWLRYAEDMEIPEIAQVLRRTQTHVKVLLFRARLKLERELTSAAGETLGRPAASPLNAVTHPKPVKVV